ncbi:hypothetical protein H7J06_00330 [Mycobacterium hodleri]|uniref:hypothetical protein n=1 Tax=Mycolicibacterium hodleri TaxID=49897 RepID=UPI0021F37EF1|nr:hypothetical protein [Mycolicibacterium hodleri]MCV7131416.1 hypothetical protein [Mycolicibacterium hodleri]
MTSGDRVVQVVGPPLSGVGGVAAALRDRLPGVVVVETDPPGRAPDAVLAVVSAAAPVARSDWAPVERAAARTDLVIGVVSKVDAHRGWRDVLAADRALVASWDAQYRSTPWVGVAAAPGLGEARVDDLVELLRRELERSPLRTRRIPVRRGPDPAEARRVLARTRLQLLRVVRDRSSALRAELREAAAEVGVGGSAAFEAVVLAESLRFHVRLADEVDRAVDAAAVDLGLGSTSHPAFHEPPDVSRAATSSRRLEGRLVAVLGVGFGLGIAVAASRLLTGLVPGSSTAGWAAGAAAGLALVAWVVRARGLLHDRALLDRWVGEVAATLRWHGEAMVAERLLAAESQWATAARAAPPPEVLPSRQLTRHDVTDQYEWC